MPIIDDANYIMDLSWVKFRFVPDRSHGCDALAAIATWSQWSRNQKEVPQAVVSHDAALTVHELSDIMPARVHLAEREQQAFSGPGKIWMVRHLRGPRARPGHTRRGMRLDKN